MPLVLDSDRLKDLMSFFYTLTGIRMVLVDDRFQEILSFPAERCDFCRYMHENAQSAAQCDACDRKAFEKCKITGDLYMYRCHAGLYEAVSPLRDNGMTIGYVMLGQITDIKSKQKLIRKLSDACSKYSLQADRILPAVKSIRYKTKEQIIAASKILDVCTGYILMREMVSLKREQMIDKIKEYIGANLDKKITICDICRSCGISRTRLYALFSSYASGGIAGFITRKRMEKACNLLKSTDLSIQDISNAVGFSDYNYFSRVFKRATGKSPNKFRK